MEKEREGCYKAIVVNGKNVLLLRDQVPKASTSRVLEGNAGGLGTQNSINIIAIEELVVKSVRDPDGPRRIAVLDDDQVVGLEVRPPHLQEVQVSNRRDHDVELVFQDRRRFCVGESSSSRHCWLLVAEQRGTTVTEETHSEKESGSTYDVTRKAGFVFWTILPLIFLSLSISSSYVLFYLFFYYKILT